MSMQPATDPTKLVPARSKRGRGRFLLLLVSVAALGLGACAPGASGVPSVPSVSLPTTDPNATPITGCLDAATMAVIDQLTADGADIPALLAANSDALVLGLNTLQPADAATTTWRDEYSFTTLAAHYDWSSWTTDVNSLGMVVGYDSDVSYNFRKQVVDGVVVRGEPIPLVPDGTDFRYYEGAARALNEFGHVVGYVSRRETGATTSRRRAFQWSGVRGDAAYDLGVLPSGTESAAEDINDGGFIVGYANETVFPAPTFTLSVRYRGFLYHPNFGLYALPAISGSGNCRATAASERAASGLIRVVGYCDLAVGTRAVRWDVTVSRVTPPSTTP